MTALTFDTHRFIKHLRDADLSEKQAEAIAEAFQEASDGANIATKNDLALTAAEMRKDMAEMKYDLIKWIVGLSLAQMSLLIGILLKLPH